MSLFEAKRRNREHFRHPFLWGRLLPLAPSLLPKTLIHFPNLVSLQVPEALPTPAGFLWKRFSRGYVTQPHLLDQIWRENPSVNVAQGIVPRWGEQGRKNGSHFYIVLYSIYWFRKQNTKFWIKWLGNCLFGLHFFSATTIWYFSPSLLQLIFTFCAEFLLTTSWPGMVTTVTSGESQEDNENFNWKAYMKNGDRGN